MPTFQTVLDNLLRIVGAAGYLVVLAALVGLFIYHLSVVLKERSVIMDLQVYQIDAWAEPDGTWTYNNSIPIRKVSIKGEPTKRKILKALRNNFLLPDPDKLPVKVDDYFTYDGIWCVQAKKDSQPLFDLHELV